MNQHDDRSRGGRASPSPAFAGLGVGAFALLLVQTGAMTLGVWGPLNGTFKGPDSYMRLLRVTECWGGSTCTAGLIGDSNYPLGEALHWPWLWDWALIAASLPFQLFTDSTQAVHIAAYISAPVLGITSMGFMISLGRKLGIGPGIAYLGLLLISQPYVILLFSYARPDHHAVQATAFTGALLGACGAMLAPRSKLPWLGGMAIGLGLWISTEGLVTALPLLGSLGVLWLAHGTRDLMAANAKLSAGALGTLAVGLLVDRPLAGVGSVEYDRMSLVHVMLFALLTLFWLLVGHFQRSFRTAGRVGAALIGAAVVALVMALLFPSFWLGPAADFPPELWTLWLLHTAEYVPLTGRIDPTEILTASAPFLYGLPLCLWAWRSHRDERAAPWLAVALCMVWFQGLTTFQQVRWATYVHLLATIPLAWGLAKGLSSLLRRGGPPLVQAGLRVGLVCAVAMAPVATATAATALAGPKDYTDVDACEPAQIVETLGSLRGPDGDPAVILASIFWGPEILYRTENRVIATPYHRNVAGIMDSHRFMAGTEAQARELAEERGITHVAICPDLFWIPYVSAEDENTFYGRLSHASYPDWLTPISIKEDGAAAIRLFEVTPRGQSLP